MLLEDMLTTDQVAIRLLVKPITAQRWIRRGKIKAYKIGRSYFVEKQEIEMFLKRQEVKAS